MIRTYGPPPTYGVQASEKSHAQNRERRTGPGHLLRDGYSSLSQDEDRKEGSEKQLVKHCGDGEIRRLSWPFYTETVVYFQAPYVAPLIFNINFDVYQLSFLTPPQQIYGSN
jgi:hypothetical protein